MSAAPKGRMKFDFDQSLDDYLQGANETAALLLASNHAYRRAVDEAYTFFVRDLFFGESSMRPTAAFLAANAFMLWLASVRVAATGHAVAAYPLFRVALESACYGFITQYDDAKEEIWRNRDDDEEAAKRCRKALTSAVKDAADIMNQRQPGIGDGVYEGYQHAIDFGAHPNARSIFSHVRFPESHEENGDVRASLSTLGQPTHLEVRRALLASLEYAFLIGTVIVHALPEATQDQADSLKKILAAQEKLIASWDHEDA